MTEVVAGASAGPDVDPNAEADWSIYDDAKDGISDPETDGLEGEDIFPELAGGA